MATYKQIAQRYLDSSVPHVGLRWSIAICLILLYTCRIAIIGGFYLVSYVIAIRLIFGGIEMITPSEAIVAPLPTSNDDVRPFIPKKAEFNVWRDCCVTVVCGFFATFLPFLNIPAYWPVLVVYVFFLGVTQLGLEVRKMMRYGYVPWTTGKTKFVKRSEGSAM